MRVTPPHHFGRHLPSSPAPAPTSRLRRWTASPNNIIVTPGHWRVRHAGRPKGRDYRENGGRRPRRATPRTMNYRISTESGFLRADLLERETADETRTFLQAVVLATVNHRCSRVLVHVRLSKPLFT